MLDVPDDDADDDLAAMPRKFSSVMNIHSGNETLEKEGL